MEEAFKFDYAKYFRFSLPDMESAYVNFLCVTANEKVNSEAEESSDQQTTNESQRDSSDVELGSKGRGNGRQRRSSGRRRRRTEGEENTTNTSDLDLLRMDFNYHCKFYAANLEERYLMFLSNTSDDHVTGQTTKTGNGKGVRNGSQRGRERSSRSGEKQRRSAPIEEPKEGAALLEASENEVEHRNAGRGRGRVKMRGGSFPMTPYQGPRRCCGEFHCRRCFRLWTSSNSRANVAQPCNGCGLFVYPHTQWPLSYGMTGYGWPEGKDAMPLDELADQENRPVGGKPVLPHFGEDMAEKGAERRSGSHRHRRPLRPQHRRRREQEV